MSEDNQNLENTEVVDALPEDGAPSGDATADRIAALEAELATAKQDILYAHADTQNVRRRLEKELADARAYAAGDRSKRDLAKETLAGVLDGDILIHNHCYRADEMALVMDMAKEMGYKVTAFHHAVESYKIADLLRENDVCSAIWADWYGFKMESYDGIRENAALLWKSGACVVIHSDDENGIQRLNQEAAKAQAAGRRMGLDIPDADVVGWFTLNAAKAMGIDKMTGSLEPGKMADVVLWNGDPLSVYSRPEKVWIDGALLYDALDRSRRPVSDFELGQPGAGDVK